MSTNRNFLFSILALGLAAQTSFATSGSWSLNGAGGWETPGNWSGGAIPNGVGDSAAFSLEITAARTVSLNGDRTVGALTIGDPTPTYVGYTLAAGTPSTSRLIFDQTGTANATLTYPVTANTASNSISAPILLNDNLAITSNVTSATPTQTLSGIISDGDNTCGLSLAGGGIITLSGYNTLMAAPPSPPEKSTPTRMARSARAR